MGPIPFAPRSDFAIGVYAYIFYPHIPDNWVRRQGAAPKNRCFYRQAGSACTQLSGKYKQDLDVYTPILKSVQSIVSASSLSMLRFALPHYRFAVNARPPEIPPHFVRCCFAVRFRFAPLRMTRADVVEVLRSEARTEQNRGEKT